MKYILNPEIELSPFHDSQLNHSWLCIIKSDDNKEFRFSLPHHVYVFIKKFTTEKSIKEVLSLSEYKNITKKEKEIYQTLINEQLLPKGIFLSEKDNYALPKLTKGKPPYMQIQIKLVNKKVVNYISKYSHHLFNRKLSITLIFTWIISQLYLYSSNINIKIGINTLSSEEQIIAIGLVGIGLLIHEFGHAAAAYRYGCRNIELGIGWYIVFIVFYAELSESWKLKKSHRLIIDCGGLYFQLIYTFALSLIYFKNGSPVIYYSIIMLNISFIWNLNPFFRMDGYWIASDILGIQNLRHTCKEEFYKFTNYILKNKKMKPEFNKKLLTYSFLGNIFFFCMLFVFTEKLLNFSSSWSLSSINELQLPTLSSLSDIVVIVSTNIFNLIFALFIVIFLINTIKSTLNFICRLKKDF